jgi:plasmid segregation protein ParM
MSNFEPNIIAIDDGYGDTKFTNGHKPYHIPSFVTEYVKKLESEIEEDNSKTFDNLVIEVDGMKYYVGKSAIEQNSEIEWEGSDNKHLNPYFPILLKSILSLMAKSEQTEIETLVWGLPVLADEDKERHELLRKIIIKTHNVKISVNGQPFTEKNITINNLIIRKQPFGSLCDIILNKEGKIIREDIAKGYNVIADIGARTFNLYTLDKLRPITDKSTHTNHGMYSAYQNINKWIESNLGSPVPDGKIKGYIDEGKIKGYSLEKITELAYKQLANRIKGVIEKTFINNWSMVDRIIFTGGGASENLLRPYLEEAFSGKNVELVFLGRYNTVMGLRKFGMLEWSKKNKVKQGDVVSK